MLGSLFGGGESEHDRILRENTEAIKRNTAEREGQFTGLGGQATLASDIGDALRQQAAELAAFIERQRAVQDPNRPGFESVEFPPRLLEQFDALGISIDELVLAAEAFDLTVVDEGPWSNCARRFSPTFSGRSSLPTLSATSPWRATSAPASPGPPPIRRRSSRGH